MYECQMPFGPTCSGAGATYMMWYKAGQWSNFGKHAYFIDLCDDGIEHFTFERTENNGLIFDRIDNETLARLNDTWSNLINCCHSYHEAIFACACSFHFCVQFLLHRFHQLWAKIFRMQKNFMFQRDLKFIKIRKQLCSVRLWNDIYLGRSFGNFTTYVIEHGEFLVSGLPQELIFNYFRESNWNCWPIK